MEEKQGHRSQHVARHQAVSYELAWYYRILEHSKNTYHNSLAFILYDMARSANLIAPAQA